ncbi:MAG TPA: hypothetical protein VEL07_00525 [Planctomycetota bacterium]|nr:hypothetical protein [Planctomycetota bacterium]
MSILEYLLRLCFGAKSPETARVDREPRSKRTDAGHAAHAANGPRSYSGHPSSRRVRPPRWIIQASNGGRRGEDLAAPLVIERRGPSRQPSRIGAAAIHG